MRKVDITMSVGTDGFYTAYCTDHPALLGGGETPAEALDELRETLRLVKKDGKEIAFIYPEWLDEEFEFQTRWNVKDLMSLPHRPSAAFPESIRNKSGPTCTANRSPARPNFRRWNPPSSASAGN